MDFAAAFVLFVAAMVAGALVVVVMLPAAIRLSEKLEKLLEVHLGP